MPTKSTTLFSLATVKTFVKAGASDHDDVLTRIADGVSERIDSYIRRPFVAREIVETRDGNDASVLQLRHFPVQSVTLVRVREALDETWETLVADDYVLDGFRGYLHLKNDSWPAAPLSCEITYQAGFAAQDSEDLPQDIVLAALRFVKSIYDRWKADIESLGSLNLQQGGSAVIVPTLPKDLTDMLDPFVKRRL